MGEDVVGFPVVEWACDCGESRADRALVAVVAESMRQEALWRDSWRDLGTQQEEAAVVDRTLSRVSKRMKLAL